MKISYKHLLNFLHKQPSIEEISEKLFQLGHENEVDNEIIDVDITPNRGDCLSLNGLARDLNFFYGYRPIESIYEAKLDTFDFNFSNQSRRDCYQISFLNIEIDNDIAPYKPYLDNYFEDLKIKKTNFFTDVSNYLIYEQGQPSHCYSFEAVKNGLTLKNLSESKSFRTLFDEDIKLSIGDLIFLSDEKIVNLAGIMGGKDSSCNENTRHVIVEFAHFTPESIIGKSTKYNLNSEAAFRFERGVDRANQEHTLRRYIKIVQDHAKIKNISIFSELKSESDNNNFVKKDFNRVNKILGTNLDEAKIENYLENLHFSISDRVHVPTFRNDISTSNDIAEEIARLIGYDNFETKKLNLVSQIKNPTLVSRVRAYLSDLGFNEVINFPFSGSKTNIEIRNPIDSNNPFIRNNLRDSLLKNLEFNEKRQKESIKIFEISDIYEKDEFDNSIKSIKKLGIVISGRRGRDFINFNQKLDKEYLLEIFKNLDVDIENKIIHHDRSEINTKSKAKIFSLEINLDELDTSKISSLKPSFTNDFISYRKISDYPSTSKDLSFLVQDESKIEELISVIKNYKDEDLIDTLLFDYFEDKKSGFFKLGFRFIFQSMKKTLTSERTSLLLHNIYQESKKIDGVSVPGYEKEIL